MNDGEEGREVNGGEEGREVSGGVTTVAEKWHAYIVWL